MATMSAVPGPVAAMNPSASALDNHGDWDFTNVHQAESHSNEPLATSRSDRSPTNDTDKPYDYGFEPLPPARKHTSIENMSASRHATRSRDRSNRSSDASTKPRYHDDTHAPKRGAAGDRGIYSDNIVKEWDNEQSKWIHRDKLAKIESRELQAAGIIMPNPRNVSRNRTGRGRSEERPGAMKTTMSNNRSESEEPAAFATRHRKKSSAGENSLSDGQTPSWDLRLPEEIEQEENDYWVSSANRSGSKIPVAKTSRVPVPETYIERHSPTSRRQSDIPPEAESIVYPKQRSRSGSINALSGPPTALKPTAQLGIDTSPRKASGTRKTSANSRAPSSGRPKTRNGSASAGSTGTTRPSTRSGELSPNQRQPEGDPPWMVGSYRPDPRLPPDQQLLPTVAKRLAQEQWEKEGKFGSVYDKDFRPLNDDALLKPYDAAPTTAEPQDEEKPADEWPLKAEAKSPGLKQGTSYSTMPKVSDKAQLGPLPSPRSPMPSPRLPAAMPQQPLVPPEATRPTKAEEAPEKKEGCGCCIVM